MAVADATVSLKPSKGAVMLLESLWYLLEFSGYNGCKQNSTSTCKISSWMTHATHRIHPTCCISLPVLLLFQLPWHSSGHPMRTYVRTFHWGHIWHQDRHHPPPDRTREWNLQSCHVIPENVFHLSANCPTSDLNHQQSAHSREWMDFSEKSWTTNTSTLGDFLPGGFNLFFKIVKLDHFPKPRVQIKHTPLKFNRLPLKKWCFFHVPSFWDPIISGAICWKNFQGVFFSNHLPQATALAKDLESLYVPNFPKDPTPFGHKPMNFMSNHDI